MKMLFVVLCARAWRDGLEADVNGERVEVSLLVPDGCYGYLPIFESEVEAIRWSAGRYPVVPLVARATAATAALRN